MKKILSILKKVFRVRITFTGLTKFKNITFGKPVAKWKIVNFNFTLLTFGVQVYIGI